ncbi:MAG: protein translocase subunit SecD [Actinomycetota bacterium]
MRKNRALWLSIIFVLALVAGSVALFATGTRPVLGLDLEGGVSVTLAAPEDTPDEVMDQALENIRARIDAFGTAEPVLFVTGNNIEAQIPGLARGTVDERLRRQFCLLDADQTSYGCFGEASRAAGELAGAEVQAIVQSACLAGGVFGDDGPCFGTEQQANDAISAIAVEELEGEFCLTGTGLEEDPCFPTREEAEAGIDGIEVGVANNYCVEGTGDDILASDFGAACYPTEEEAQTQLDALRITERDREFCVVSSADRQLGCFLSRDEAEARLQETGQERLLQVIGQTARLEFRPVRETITPGSPTYDTTPADCATPTEVESDECSFEALRDQEVVLFDRAQEVKYKLGPVAVTGDAITRAQAVFDSGGGTAIGQGWIIDFALSDAGSDAFADITTELAGAGSLAIVVDRKVISAPTVNEPITGGTAIIEGSFTENRAKDLATQLNAGALPVELTTQQVVTVSPTLGRESLDDGILAGVAGLILLAFYLLYYYRVLALIAWLGMTIWAVLALALVALAGRTVGYSLTLAGVAGLIISLGVTADSYIVFFERFKDEVHGGKSPRAAVQPAFKKAFRTIVAADIVTALAAIVLYITAISSVRGFALTLGVSVLLDLFVVYFFKRPAAFLLARNERLVMMRGIGVTSAVAADHEAPAYAGSAQ